MNIYEEILTKSLDFDASLIDKYSLLFECEDIEQGLSIGNLLIEPLIPDHCSSPKHCRLSSRQIDLTLLQEWKEMLNLLHTVNKDRLHLRKLASQLLLVLSRGQTSNNHFENYLVRAQAVHYELIKTFLDKERKRNEQLEAEVLRLTAKEYSDFTVQVDTICMRPNAASDISMKLDCSITSDTTSSPLNLSIDLFSIKNSNFIDSLSMSTARGLKRPTAILNTTVAKPVKKTEEDKHPPVMRKALPRKLTKN